jgi:hypothetical protein
MEGMLARRGRGSDTGGQELIGSCDVSMSTPYIIDLAKVFVMVSSRSVE